MSKCLRLAVTAAFALFLFSVSALAQQAPPSADTYTSSSTPTTNYGSSIILVVGSGTNTYMKFNLSGVPAGASVSKATLRLFVDAVVTGGQFDVYNLPGTPTWSESTLKYNTPPPALGTSATGGHPIAVSSSSYNTFLLIDISATVQGWLTNPSSNNGVALGLIGSTGWFSFDSKESFLTAHQPELEIVLNGSAGAQGPQGPQGPPGSTGATGPAGPAGAVGPVGPVGPKGSTGATGSQGLAGPTGATGPQGQQGATGATGAMGPMGLQGPAGTNGTNGTNGTGFNFRGAFDAGATYATNDVVTFNGSTYLAIAPNQGPSNPNPDVNPAWTLMAQQGAAGATGATGPKGDTGPQGPAGTNGTNGVNGATGAIGPQGPQGFMGPTGPQGPQGATGQQGPAGTSGGDPNSRMIFPSFFPGNLSGTWVGGQFILDQPITVLRIAATAKTPTGASCPAAVFRFTDGTKGQDLALTPGQYWSDSGPMVLTFAAGSTLKASLRTGSTCASNTGADANLLVEYKMQASGDTDSCLGTSCSGICTTTSSDPSNCGTCGTACASGVPCASGTCSSGGGCNPPQTLCGMTCTSLITDPNNCGTCGNACASGQSCVHGSCSSAASCTDGVKDGNETGIDCGGGICHPCGSGQGCILNSDCQSNSCVGNFCQAASCPSGQTLCGSTCTTLSTDPNNCGGCGQFCPSGSSCSNGICSCVPPHSPTPCLIGTCINGVPSLIPAPAGTSCGLNLSCDGGGNCVSSCPSGQTLCGSTCTNTSVDTKNCGGCGAVCSMPNSTPACVSSACKVGACNAGFGDCNGIAADGCETNLNTSVANCGVCGNACASGQSCTNGLCSTATGAVCGNGIRETGEQCDDSNTANLDGCNSSCGFEQNQRINSLQLMGTTDSFCAQNGLGQSFTSIALGQFNPVLNASIAAGTVTEIFAFMGLTDLTGTTTQPSIQLGVVGGTPVAGTGYSGTSDLDWWYTVDPTTIGINRLPLTQVPASIAASVLTAGPATMNLPFAFSAGTPVNLIVRNANLSATLGAASAPIASAGNPPGHLAAEHLDPALQSFATMGMSAAGKLCGSIGADSLAATPIPANLVQGGSAACAAVSGSASYSASNSMLDVLVSGCKSGFLGAITVVNPEQPDVFLSGSVVCPLTADPTTHKVNNSQSCVAADAYSSYFQFTTDRVIVK